MRARMHNELSFEWEHRLEVELTLPLNQPCSIEGWNDDGEGKEGMDAQSLKIEIKPGSYFQDLYLFHVG